jgi:tetrapyrrole methylase family protein / MazG family protein
MENKYMLQKNDTENIQKLIEIIKHLRSPEGCPWDRKQTHVSLKPMLVEETAELLDAIDAKDDENIREELGDVLMHVIFHSLIAEDEKRFTFSDVVNEIAEKMERRHPHIFGSADKLNEADQVVELWKEIKKKEKAAKGIEKTSSLTGTPKNLPALLRSRAIQKKAAAVGFDWDNTLGILKKIDEEVLELKHAFADNNDENIDEEIGDILFSVVNLSRYRKGKSAEELLHKTVDKFEKRFQFMEDTLNSKGIKMSDCSIDELEMLWQKAKLSE